MLPPVVALRHDGHSVAIGKGVVMIDTETYQLISLGLGALLLLVLLLVLSALGKINKTLGSIGSVQTGEAEPVRQEAQETPEVAEPVAEPHPVVEPVQTATHEPAAQQVTPEPQQTWAEPAAVEEPQPAAVQPTSQPAAEPAPQPVASDAVPEEQPFERDGRWWFKRGLEILVYDEQTGQWQPAAADNPFAASPGSQAGAVTTQVPVAQDTGAGFWKCPSCGAVNGATSATCRMCFAARP